MPKKVTVTFDNYDSSVVGTVWRNGSEVISSVTSRSATDTAPDYSTYYSYSARYKYATGSSTCTFGSFSSEAFICTYPGNVQNIQANAVNSSWVMLSWDAPESGTVDGYQWYITENNKNNVTSNKNVNITSLSAASTHLLYVTTYYICPDGNVLEGLPQPITVYTAPQSVVLTAIGVSSSEIQLTVTTTNVITNLSISRDGSEIVWNLRSGDTYTDSGLSAGKSIPSETQSLQFSALRKKIKNMYQNDVIVSFGSRLWRVQWYDYLIEPYETPLSKYKSIMICQLVVTYQ